MLAAHCPSCGATNAVSLAQPDRYECTYCKYDGPPPDKVREPLQHAARVVQDLDHRRLQLSAEQQRALEFGWTGRAIYAGLLLLLTLPSVLVAKACATGPTIVTGLPALVLTYGPVVVVVALGAHGLRKMWSARHELEEACSAIPPRAPGTPARCHVCGAPLTPAPSRAVARCEYCRADNIVSPRVLSRMQDKQRGVFREYADAVRDESEALSSITVIATARLAAVALLAPAASVAIVTFVAILSLYDPFGPVDRSREYLLIRRDAAACIGRLVDETVYFGRDRVQGFPPRVPAPDEEDREPILPEDVVGERVLDRGGEVGIVRKAFQNPHGGGNQFEIDMHGRIVYQRVPGTCLAETDDESP
jgi:hypothetical protein